MELHDLLPDSAPDMLEDAAKLWLAMDGLWFQTVEEDYGLEKAIELDRKVWEQFSVIEGRRIMQRLGLEEGGGLEALKTALKFRLYAYVNQQEMLEEEGKLVFRMNDCRVQAARARKNLPDFPCKSVGLVEYTQFARTIDPRIETRCIACPPDPHPPEYYCCWEFTMKE